MTRTARPLWPLLAALAAGALGLGDWWAGRHGTPAVASSAPQALRTASAPPCPAESLLDDGVCVPLPLPEEHAADGASRIELLPGRPPEYSRYLTPLASQPAAASASGLGVFIAAPRGTPVMAIALEAQIGPARRLVLASPTPRLVTLHQVERAGAKRSYLLLYDGIAVEPATEPSDIAVGTPLGRITPGASTTGLTIEVRQLRRGVEPAGIDAASALRDDSSLSCDARNVLPLKPAP